MVGYPGLRNTGKGYFVIRIGWRKGRFRKIDAPALLVALVSISPYHAERLYFNSVL